MKKNIVLASASPRRKELLKNAGVKFEIITADIDECLPGGVQPQLAVQELALKKAAAVLRKVKNSLVIGADTIVVIDGKILGKPKNEQDAFNILSALSGRTHEVYTGIAVISAPDMKAEARAIKSEVTFKKLSETQIKDYISTGEPMDKAGAYGIQGMGESLIQSFSGHLDNIIGLPTEDLFGLLKEEFGWEEKQE